MIELIEPKSGINRQDAKSAKKGKVCNGGFLRKT